MSNAATRGLAAGAALLLLGGCADRVTAPLAAPEDERAEPALVTQLSCAADVAAGTLSCEPESIPPAAGGANPNLIVGSQHQFVRMANSVPTTVDDVWSADVTVQNLTLQPMGTSDGAAPDGTGIRVFFVQEPTNGVVIGNHDGSSVFTGAAPQKFYRYIGADLGGDGILTPGETSAAGTWEFQLNGAASFRFSVLISTVVPDQDAYNVHLTGITAGALHTCAAGSDGAAYCWGSNPDGQLGDGTTTDRNTPTAVSRPGGVTLTGITAGFFHTCAAGSDGKAYCWGVNFNGHLGDGTYTDRNTPTAVSVPEGVTLTGITAGYGHTCAAGSDGAAYCWGHNGNGQLGDGTNTVRNTPTAVSGPGGVTLTGITAGEYHTCAEGSDGTAYCWGLNGHGQLGDGTTTDRTTPTAVSAPGGATLTGITPGFYHTCAAGSDGKAYCWGRNGDGQLGDGTTTARNTPTAVTGPAGETLTGITPGIYHTCAAGSDGAAYCWGRNGHGQLGDGTTTARNIPTAVSSPEGVTLTGITVGYEHACAVGSNGPAYCWGYNLYAQLGDGTTTQRVTPVVVAGTR